ncbi:ShlB/FhaC/HecB family hemolysin secretion/activation protein [Chitinimonas naiadis]
MNRRFGTMPLFLSPCSRPQPANWLRYASTTLLVLVSLSSRAAVDNQAEERLKKEEDKARAILDRLADQPDVLKPTVKRGALPQLAPEDTCFTLEKIVIESDEAHFRALADKLAFARGRCIGATGLRELLGYVNDTLIDEGYVTSRAMVPEQNLASRTLVLKVVPGRIAAVRYSDDADGIWRNAVPVRLGEVLNLRNLEQGVEHMQRLSSQQVRTDIQPGGEPGSSDLIIERQRGRSLYGGVQVDNTGSGSFGALQGNANLVYDNPLGINDQLNLSFSSNLLKLADDNRSQSAVVGYSVPYRFMLVSGSAAYSTFAQRIQGVTQTFLSHGDSKTLELRDQYVVWRTDADRLALTLSVNSRRSHSYIDDTEITVQRRRTSNLELGASYRHRFENGSLDVSYTRRKGMSWMGAQDDLASAFEGGVTLRPDIDNIDIGYNTQRQWFGRPVGISTRLHAQAAHQATLVTDHLSIGTQGTVRGFEGLVTLSAERGWFWRNEFSTPLLGQSVYLAIDAGRVWGPSAGALIGDKLVGSMLGLRGQLWQFNYEAAIGTPLSRPSGFQSRTINTYINLGYSF